MIVGMLMQIPIPGRESRESYAKDAKNTKIQLFAKVYRD
jgi:hypothetical protein